MKYLSYPRWSIASLLLSVAVLVACSGGSSTSGEAASNVAKSDPAPAVEPTATTDPTPIPPTPTPTPTPEPEPVFSRVVMPENAVSEPTRAFWRAAAPAAGFDWLGVGHEFNAATGLSVPITWEFESANKLLYEPLPIEPGEYGNAFYATVIGERQLVGGQVYQNDIERAAMWHRDSPDADWTRSETIVADLPGRSAGTSAVWDLVSGDDWGMALLGFESGTEFDADGEPAITRYVLFSNDGIHWDPISLPGIDPHDWRVWQFASGANGLIAAVSSDEDNPAAKIFTSSDSGTSWAGIDVAINDDLPVGIRGALWRDGSWLVAGSQGAEGSRQAATFTLRDGEWHPELANLAPTDEFSDVDHEFAAINQLDDGTLLAIVDRNNGSRTVTSADGQQWTNDTSLWLNQYTDTAGADLSQLVADPNNDRFLAVRGFDRPVWLGASTVRSISALDFARTERSIHGLLRQGDELFLMTFESSDPYVTTLWRSDDGNDWNRTTIDEGFGPVDLPMSFGNGIYVTGYDNDARLIFRVYGNGRSRSQFPGFETLRVPNRHAVNFPITGPATGRQLLASVITNKETDTKITVFSFINLPDGDEVSTFLVPSANGRLARAVCPQRPTGEIVVPVSDLQTFNSSTIEIWADQPDPQLGVGFVVGSGFDFPGIAVDCTGTDEALLLSGTTCIDHPVTETGDVQFDYCAANLWTSPDGYVWTEHPGRSRLVDEGVNFLADAAASDQGWLVTGQTKDRSEDNTLWLVTDTEILPVPLDDIVSLTAVDIDHVEVLDNVVVITAGSSVFVGDLDYLVERTLAEAGSEPPSTTSTTAATVGVEVPPMPELAAPILLEPQANEAPQTPAAPAPRPTTPPSTAPAPAAVPTAVPTSPPTTSTTLPQCAPGQLTTTGQCRCSGGRLYDDGGQCKVRCRGSEQPDGFGGCVKADGSTVDPGTSGGSGSVPLAEVCVVVNEATGETFPCDDN